jgi:hypothetical protein
LESLVTEMIAGMVLISSPQTDAVRFP